MTFFCWLWSTFCVSSLKLRTQSEDTILLWFLLSMNNHSFLCKTSGVRWEHWSELFDSLISLSAHNCYCYDLCSSWSIQCTCYSFLVGSGWPCWFNCALHKSITSKKMYNTLGVYTHIPCVYSFEYTQLDHTVSDSEDLLRHTVLDNHCYTHCYMFQPISARPHISHKCLEFLPHVGIKRNLDVMRRK